MWSGQASTHTGSLHCKQRSASIWACSNEKPSETSAGPFTRSSGDRTGSTWRGALGFRRSLGLGTTGTASGCFGVSESTVFPLGPPSRCVLILSKHISRARNALADGIFRLSDGPVQYRSNSWASHHRAENQFRATEGDFLHLETYKLSYRTYCPARFVSVVFVNRLVHTPPRT